MSYGCGMTPSPAIQLLRLLPLLCILCVTAGCSAPSGGLAPLLSKPTASPAMLRFQQLQASYPALAELANKEGTPDYTDERSSSKGVAVMCYYLKPGKAWLAIIQPSTKEAAILGPETIGKKELDFLRAAKALND
jgi:hypothetical protein